MKDWEKHVTKTPGKAWCGANLTSFDWAFVDRHHAVDSVKSETRVQPCPGCFAAITKGGDNGTR